MTGFAQAGGTMSDGRVRWVWDLKTVNAKGLDLRLRLPHGFDRCEINARRRIASCLARGTCHATLTIVREASPALVRIDTDRLAALMHALADVSRPASIGPATLDGLLALRGIVEIVDDPTVQGDQDALVADCDHGLDRALDALIAMRELEGATLRAILADRLEAIGRLTRSADVAPQRRPEAVRAKLAATIVTLAERYPLDPDRLHQEALILAAKADVREELDRLASHVSAARTLLDEGGAVGRRLDFLAQELGREASTYCAKVNDAALTAIGLDLRVEIEQFREQIQNIE